MACLPNVGFRLFLHTGDADKDLDWLRKACKEPSVLDGAPNT